MNPQLSRLGRIPARIGHDSRIVKLVVNWRQFLGAKLTGAPVTKISLRNGVTLESPVEMDLNFLFHEIWLDEIYAPPGYQLSSGETVVDIGGNIGVFAMWAATRAPGVKVTSYEPFPENAKYFLRNLHKSGLSNVSLVQTAVAGAPGKRILNVAPAWGCHSLAGEGTASKGVEVSCTTLDAIVGEMGAIDLLKVDCEGGEYEIFRNAAPETLKSIRRIVLEYHNTENGNGAEIRNIFENAGFKVDVFQSIDDWTGLLCASRHSAE